METNSFTWLELRTPISNLKFLPLYEEFAIVAHFHTVISEVPAIFSNVDTRIKGAQIGDHEIKQ